MFAVVRGEVVVPVVVVRAVVVVVVVPLLPLDPRSAPVPSTQGCSSVVFPVVGPDGCWAGSVGAVGPGAPGGVRPSSPGGGTGPNSARG